MSQVETPPPGGAPGGASGSASGSEPGNAPRSSPLRRLRYTPLRDLVRGRLSGRLDLQDAVDRQELPASLARTVWSVTRRTRLFRLERATVARELAAHFADGLAEGRSPEELHEAFGDEKQAALLIRRAKKRGRSIALRVTHGVAIAIVLLLLVYVLAGLHFLSGKPDPKTDYRVQLNAAASGVREHERAWPLYREALLQLPPVPTFDRFTRAPRPGEDGWEAAAAYLEEGEPAIALAREAAARPGLGLPLGLAPTPEDRELWPGLVFDENDDRATSLVNVALPHLESFRKLARVVALDARRAAAAGDGATVLADVETILALARHLRESPVFIGDLVAYSIVLIAVHVAGDIIHEHPGALSLPVLRALAHRFSLCDPTLTPRYEGERLMFADIVQRVYTDDGDGDGRVTMAGLRVLNSLRMASDAAPGSDADHATPMAMIPAMHAIMLSRREVVAEFDRLMTIFEVEAGRPLWETDTTRADRLIAEWKSSEYARMRHLPLTLVVPALGRSDISAELVRTERDGLLVGVALTAYHRRHDAWPRSQVDLVPESLPLWPADCFDGGPLRYAVVDGRPVVYSVGTDRDDDGGRPAPVARGGEHRYDAARRWVSNADIEVARANAARQGGGALALRAPGQVIAIPDGDWVLWPRPIGTIRRLDLD